MRQGAAAPAASIALLSTAALAARRNRTAAGMRPA